VVGSLVWMTVFAAVYLHHGSELGEFFLSSDSVIPTFTKWDSARHITELFSEEENEAFRTTGYTIGGMMVFPGNRIDGKQTINGARGFNRKIADRFDLTLECIRRHYLGQRSPLGETLVRYRDFFALFDDFNAPSVPRDGDTYKKYRRLSIEFIKARNCRIDRYAAIR